MRTKFWNILFYHLNEISPNGMKWQNQYDSLYSEVKLKTVYVNKQQIPNKSIWYHWEMWISGMSIPNQIGTSILQIESNIAKNKNANPFADVFRSRTKTNLELRFACSACSQNAIVCTLLFRGAYKLQSHFSGFTSF